MNAWTFIVIFFLPNMDTVCIIRKSQGHNYNTYEMLEMKNNECKIWEHFVLTTPIKFYLCIESVKYVYRNPTSVWGIINT